MAPEGLQDLVRGVSPRSLARGFMQEKKIVRDTADTVSGTQVRLGAELAVGPAQAVCAIVVA